MDQFISCSIPLRFFGVSSASFDVRLDKYIGPFQGCRGVSRMKTVSVRISESVLSPVINVYFTASVRRCNRSYILLRNHGVRIAEVELYGAFWRFREMLLDA